MFKVLPLTMNETLPMEFTKHIKLIFSKSI